MKFKSVIAAFIVLMLFCAAGGVYGEEELPSLKEFGEKVKALVIRYYPKAEVSITDEEITFEYGTRKFMVHDMDKMGIWSEGAYEVKGPKRKFFTKEDEKESGIGRKESGIAGYIRVKPWKYVLSKVRPQTWGWTYFKVLMLAPESEKFDCHLMVDLKYPDTVNKEFVKEFTALMNNFEKYLK